MADKLAVGVVGPVTGRNPLLERYESGEMVRFSVQGRARRADDAMALIEQLDGSADVVVTSARIALTRVIMYRENHNRK